MRARDTSCGHMRVSPPEEEAHPMLDLITTLYDWDTFRVTLWHTLDMFGLDACLTTWLESQGYIVWEDFSISEAAS